MGAKPCSRLSAEAGVLSWGRPKASQDDFWPRTCFCSTIHQLVLLVRHGDPLLVLLPQVWGRSCPPQVPGREAWHGELGWIHLSEALSGLPLSTSNHLEGRWLGQAGCLCSCCAPWGEAGTSGGQITRWLSSCSSPGNTAVCSIFMDVGGAQPAHLH